MRIVAALTDPLSIRAYLEGVGLPGPGSTVLQLVVNLGEDPLGLYNSADVLVNQPDSLLPFRTSQALLTFLRLTIQYSVIPSE